ncbi:MAG: hypothetical protein J5794_05025, partial [Lachnospiraceae bacterium]|nr:hypothetical protein [Lachnospiraceae bacterium]
MLGAVLAAGIAVGAAFLFAGKKDPQPETEGTSAPVSETESDTTEEDPWADEPDYSGLEIYWNVDRNQYGKTETGISTRQVDQNDGFYHILFACNGRQIERRVENRKLVNRIDSMDVMGLIFDERNVVIDVVDIEEFTGGYLYHEVFVMEIDEDGVVHMNSDAAGNGT